MCPRRAATIPGAGAVRGNHSQLEARFNPGTIRPNTRVDAPQPQKERGQPAGPPPTTLPRPPFTSASSVRCEIARGARLCWFRRCDAHLRVGEVAGHGYVAFGHIDGRALEESTKKEAISNRIIRMQNSGSRSLPRRRIMLGESTMTMRA